ncbi:phosphoesterase [Halorubrum sp. Ib24]|uniref:2'-5' RNA ligase family protein n=1 Tax=unclassified Halorubrum TaxID=2642239 RepID=UPI000B989878|nr:MULTISPECIES: 2'-5' RNA ligase family protein [unclassified Halorubrum]OYR41749.1 phosphoesterase [Halorubrum sp. Eb13]OYR43068.1 phosphoesterase [Halorubrum sp. Ib24]OYR52698.1 phosphoesterase [Halorubrum sp. Ea1]
MFSLNVPLPPAVGDLAADLHPKLSGFDRVRDRHTLVCKRLGVDNVPDRVASAARPGPEDVGSAAEPSPPKPDALEALRGDLRPLLSGTDPFEVAATGIDVFDAPASGSRPVVYLAVESEVLVRLHQRLCAAYGAIEGIEGDDFVPHVTLARGGNPAPGVVADLVGAAVDPIRWRVHALDLYDPEFREVAATIDL